MGERVPFEGQTLGNSLSEPDVAGEQAAIDSQFSEPMDDPDFKENMTEEESFALAEKHGGQPPTPKTTQDKLLSEIMDEKGNLKPDSQFMDREEDEEEEDDRPQSEDDLMDRMARKAVHHISSFRDAWMVMKNEQEPEFCDNCADPYQCSCPSKREMNERIIQENELKRFLGGGRGSSPVR
jgi:hypothetical protein